MGWDCVSVVMQNREFGDELVDSKLGSKPNKKKIIIKKSIKEKWKNPIEYR